MKRAADLVIGPEHDPYMHRWMLKKWRNGVQLALHKIWRSDDERAPHDHVGWNVSVLLTGPYIEILFEGTKEISRHKRWPLIPYFRQATQLHRLVTTRPVWTLWLRGPHIREWGFFCPRGWRHWTIFVAERDFDATGSSTIGRGCD